MNNHNFSKHRWWKTCRKELMRSLTRCVRANILMTWLRIGSQKLPIRLEYQIFYKLTKIHVPILVGRSIISGCEGPTERISSFVETLPQPMVQLQQSYRKDATAFHQFHRKNKGRQYFHGGNWNEINPTKRNQAKRMETLHWWLPLGLRQRRSRWFIKRAN